MFKPINMQDLMKNPVVTLEITHPDGTVTKENRDIVAVIDRLNGYAHKYMKRGRYSVIGKFYDQIIWTFDPLV